MLERNEIAAQTCKENNLKLIWKSRNFKLKLPIFIGVEIVRANIVMRIAAIQVAVIVLKGR